MEKIEQDAPLLLILPLTPIPHPGSFSFLPSYAPSPPIPPSPTHSSPLPLTYQCWAIGRGSRLTTPTWLASLDVSSNDPITCNTCY